jgi:tripartite-type tricarboxylate transporter receptor subunit TctC
VRLRVRLALALLALGLGGAARADDVAAFYKDRSVALIVGYSVGGGYDLYARLVARYLGAHIPGQPTLVPQNMPGAGSLKAAEYLYAVAPKTGAVIGTMGRSMGVEPLLGRAHYDGTRFTWLGSVTDEASLCVTWHSAAVKSWTDLLTTEATFGGNGPGSDPDMFALLLKNLFGAKIKLVTGYPGSNDITLAMERGEIDGYCGMSVSSLKSRHPSWLADKQLNFLVQAALRKHPDFPDVPLLSDIAKTPEERQIVRLVAASQEMARPFLAPPDLPADRAAALRAGFDATMRDPEFLAEARRLELEVNPVDGAAIASLLAELYATPKDVVAKATRAIAK